MPTPPREPSKTDKLHTFLATSLGLSAVTGTGTASDATPARSSATPQPPRQDSPAAATTLLRATDATLKRALLRPAGVYRRTAFRGLVADAILHLDARDPAASATPAAAAPPAPLLAIYLERFSNQAAADLAAYAADFAPGLSWVLLGGCGRARWQLAGGTLGRIDSAAPSDAAAAPTAPADVARQRLTTYSTKQTIFTAKAQWLLKTLMLPGLDQRYAQAFRPRAPATLQELASAEALSQPTVSRVVRDLTAAGFLRREGSRVHLQNVSDLLTAWADAAALLPAPRLGVAWPGTTDPEAAAAAILKTLQQRPPAFTYAVSGALAANATLAAPPPVTTPLLLYADAPAATVVAHLGLVAASSGAVPVVIIRPSLPTLIFTPAVTAAAVRATDSLQTYLDLRQSGDSGAAAARAIMDAVLLPHFWRQRCF